MCDRCATATSAAGARSEPTREGDAARESFTTRARREGVALARDGRVREGDAFQTEDKSRRYTTCTSQQPRIKVQRTFQNTLSCKPKSERRRPSFVFSLSSRKEQRARVRTLAMPFRFDQAKRLRLAQLEASHTHVHPNIIAHSFPHTLARRAQLVQRTEQTCILPPPSSPPLFLNRFQAPPPRAPRQSQRARASILSSASVACLHKRASHIAPVCARARGLLAAVSLDVSVARRFASAISWAT